MASVSTWVRSPQAFPREVTPACLRDLGCLLTLWEARGEVEPARDLAVDGLEVALRSFHPAGLVHIAAWVATLTAKGGDPSGAEIVLATHRERVEQASQTMPDAVRVLDMAVGEVRQWAGDFGGALDAWRPLMMLAAPDATQSENPYREPAEHPMSPGAPQTVLLVARLLIHLENFDEATDLLMPLGEKPRAVGQVIDIYLGTLERERRNFEAAHAHYDDAEQTMNAHRVPHRGDPRRALAHGRARLYLAQEQWDQAEALALDALLDASEEGGDTSQALVDILPDLGWIWIGQGREEEAARATRRALALADHWRVGAFPRAGAEIAFAAAHHDSDPVEAAEALDAADSRLARSLTPTHRLRTRIAELRQP